MKKRNFLIAIILTAALLFGLSYSSARAQVFDADQLVSGPSYSGFVECVSQFAQCVASLVDLASDVSGVLGISNGGTGTSTAPANGQLLIGNASGGWDYIASSTLATLTNYYWTKSGTHLYYTGGNVGIGTTTPGQTLSVAGTGLFSGLATFMSGFNIGSNTFTSLLGNGLTNVGGALSVSTTSLASGFFQQGGNSFGATATLGTNDANNLEFEAGGTSHAALTTGGNFGIGTLNPAYKLAVTDSSGGANANLRFYGTVTAGYTASYFLDDTGLKIGHNSASRDLQLQTGGSTRLTITGAGNLGIGTTNPLAKLQINSGTNANIQVGGTAGAFANATYFTDLVTFQNGVNMSRVADGAYTESIFNYVGSNSLSNLGLASRGDIKFVVGSTANRGVVIKESGNVGIGTTSPRTGLDIYHSLGRMYLRNTAAADASTTGGALLSHTTSGTFTIQGASSGIAGSAITTTFDLANQRVGIGTASPADKLHIAQSAGPIQMFMTTNTTGHTAGDGLRIRVEDSGFASFGTMENQGIGLYTNATERFRITAAGNVGIGTSTPAATLHIASLDVSDTPGSAHKLQFSHGGTGLFGWRMDSGNNNLVLDRGWGGNWTPAMAINRNTGNVGIGTINPLSRFVASSASSGVAAMTLGSPTGVGLTVANSDAAYGVNIGTHSTGNGWIQVGRIDGTATSYDLGLQPSGGNVGIGTTTPTGVLAVHGAAGAASTTAPRALAVYGGQGGPSDTTGFAGGDIWLEGGKGGTAPTGFDAGRGGNVYLYGGPGGPYNSWSAGVGGDVYIDAGITGPGGAAEKGNLILGSRPSGSNAAGPFIGIRDHTPSINGVSVTGSFGVGTTTTADGGLFMVQTVGGGTVGVGTTTPWRRFSVVGTVAFNGLTSSATGNALCITTGKDVTDAGGGTCTPSSIRFKENVLDLPGGQALSILERLRVVSFDYKPEAANGEDPHAYGLIAEEVEAIDTRLVDYGANGSVFSLHFERITGLLVQAVQELAANDNDQNNRLDRLEARIEALERENTGLRAGACFLNSYR